MENLPIISPISGITSNERSASSASMQTELSFRPCKLLTTAYLASCSDGRRVILGDYKVSWDPKQSPPLDEDLGKLEEGVALRSLMEGWDFENCGLWDEDEALDLWRAQIETYAMSRSLTGRTHEHVNWQAFERSHPKNVMCVARTEELPLDVAQSWESRRGAE